MEREGFLIKNKLNGGFFNMNNELEVFKNEEFGTIRTLSEGDSVLFCASDVAKALGYAVPRKAVLTTARGF